MFGSLHRETLEFGTAACSFVVFFGFFLVVVVVVVRGCCCCCFYASTPQVDYTDDRLLASERR